MHYADTNKDGVVSLDEFCQLIELINSASNASNTSAKTTTTSTASSKDHYYGPRPHDNSSILSSSQSQNTTGSKKLRDYY